MGALAFVFPVIAVCASLCPSDNASVIFFHHPDCGITNHTFVPMGDALSALFILPLLLLFLVINVFSIPAGYRFPMFKPPRFSS
jgi:hypothetical protein